MKDEELLEYGFVVYLKGEATYDHVVKAKLPYANKLIAELQCATHPIIAQRFYPSEESGVRSPIFRYVSTRSGIGSYQSAYYLADALMRKGVLPVYIRATGEVKDLMPLLSEDQKRDAMMAMQILRARYIKADKRQPAKAFMVKTEFAEIDSSTIELSDQDMMKIFGRLPGAAKEKIVPIRNTTAVQVEARDEQEEPAYIDDGVASRA